MRRGQVSALRKREERKGWLFLLPSLIGLSVFVLVPFVNAVKRSFFEAVRKQFVGFDNYKTVLNNEAFKLAVKNSGRFIVTCIPILLIVSLIISLLVFGQKKYGNFFKTSFLMPMSIPVASIVLLWKVFFHKNGLINVLLIKMDMNPVDWMNTDKAFYILVFSYLWKNVGYDMVLWLAGLNGISQSLYEAAAIDGAGAWAKFKYITLPGLSSTIFVVTVLSLINSFKVFREAYLTAGDYPHRSIYMLQHLFNNWFVALDIQKMCAAAVLVAICIIAFILILQKVSLKEEEE